MIVERAAVFESNSSSCHSLVRMKKKDWLDFRDGRVLLKRYNFDMEEHVDRYNKVNEDELVTYEDFYEMIKKDLPYLHQTKDDYPFDEFDEAVIKYIKENWSLEFCKKLLTTNWNEIAYEFPEEVTVEYNHWGSYGTPYVAHHKHITFDNIVDILNRQYKCFDENDSEGLYCFQDENGWKEAAVFFLHKEGEQDTEVLVDRWEEC